MALVVVAVFVVVMIAGIAYAAIFSKEPFVFGVDVTRYDASHPNALCDTARTSFNVSDIDYFRQKFWND